MSNLLSCPPEAHLRSAPVSVVILSLHLFAADILCHCVQWREAKAFEKEAVWRSENVVIQPHTTRSPHH